ncbi:MAG TPA: hypothetical protein EYO33_06575 [Phycisphaerales bacterium]|nr:hypothetical protein [Phycisphaerales bacterium]
MSCSSVSEDVWEAGVEWGSCHFRLSGNDPTDRLWLEDFLTPWYLFSDHCRGRHIRLWHDDEAYARATTEMEVSSTSPRNCFSLDSQLIVKPGWTTSGRTTVFDEIRMCFYQVFDDEITLLTRAGSVAARVSLVRTLRELAWQRTCQTMLALHSSALVFAGRAFLILGPKRAGKTTLLSYLLNSTEAEFLSNDWVMLERSDLDEIVVRGVPTVIRVREGTQEFIPQLKLGLDTATRFITHSNDERATLILPLPPPGPAEEVFLNPADFSRNLRSRPLASAPLGGLLFPVKQDDESFRTRIIPPVEAKLRIEECLYGLPGNRPAKTIFGEPSGNAEMGEIESWVGKIPCWEVALGTQAFASTEVALQLLARISLSGAHSG